MIFFLIKFHAAPSGDTKKLFHTCSSTPPDMQTDFDVKNQWSSRLKISSSHCLIIYDETESRKSFTTS